MSLSKIGLPSTRTGILIAREEIIDAVSSANAIVSLANGSVGQAIMQPLVESGEILRLSREVVKPFYLEKSRKARAWIDEAFSAAGVDYSVHLSEGSLFLWVWFRALRSNTYELYQRLKERNTIVVPGRYFSFGLEEPWDHADQCIRLNYAMDDEQVRRGIEIIAEEAATLQR
jgi:valine--pyruvate aminotransferase